MTSSASDAAGAARAPAPEADEAPLDLRLVPAALGAWLACALAVGATARGVAVAAAGLVGLAVAGGALHVVAPRRRAGAGASGAGHGLRAVASRRRAAAGRTGAGAARMPRRAVDPGRKTPRRVDGDRAGAGGGPPAVRSASWPGAVLALGVAGVLLAGCAAQLHARERGPLAALAAERAVVTVEGVVRDDPRLVRGHPAAPPRRAVTVSALTVEGRGTSGPVGSAVTVLGDEAWDGVPVGSRVRVTGRTAPGEPGDEAVAVLVAWDPPDVVVPAGPLDAAVDRLRSGLLDATAGLDGDARALVPGAAIGDTSRVPEDLGAAMRVAGLTHVTAVSGAHFAVLAVAVLWSGARLPRRVRAVVCGVVLAGFVLLVRPEPSVVRAAAMGAVTLVGLAAGRRSRALPALAAAVVVLLAVDPWLARSYGFVLSVTATAAIVLLAPALVRAVPARVPRWAAVGLAVPVAAQAACAPVLVLLDPHVAVHAVAANVVAAPAVAPATLLGLATTLVAPVAPGVAEGLAQVAGVPAAWVGTVARAAAGAPGAQVGWPAGPGGAALLATATAAVVVGGALVLRALRAHRRDPSRPRRLRPAATAAALAPAAALATTLAVALATVLVTVFVTVLVTVPAGRLGGGAPGDWRLVLCDVGQGDALVVRTGDASAVVVDVGPDGAAAGRCLDALGVRRVDLLVLTHHHADHVGGLPAVLAGREVVRALVSPLPEPAGQARRTLEALAEAGVPVDVALAGTGDGGAGDGHPDGSGTAGDVVWDVVWPRRAPVPVAEALAPVAPAGERPEGAEGSEVNDASVVLRLDVAGLDVVALGDVEPPAQEQLVALLPGPVDVVKVAHHGSAHQSERLALALAPSVALVGVGADNGYGHPAPATLALYERAGALVVPTDRCGRVAVGGAPGAVRVWAACL